jgi:hypothetical protein
VKYLASSPPILARPRLGRLVGLGFLAAAVSVAGCADDKVHQLGAQSSPEAVADSSQGGSPQLSAADTATRTVGHAISRADSVRADSIQRADSLAEKDTTVAKVKYNAGEDPEFARAMGWPVHGPKKIAGAILPEKRIVAYYGNPLSKRMGVLGEYPKDEMLRKLDKEVAEWNKADPAHPVQPALHLIAVVAQGDPGKAGQYRMIMPDTVVKEVYGWAKEHNSLLFVDIQTGQATIQEILPRFDWILKNPDVHLAVDPEFMMVYDNGAKPGAKIGSMDVSDINYVTNEMAKIVRKYNLPPKVVVIHRFTKGMVVGDTKDIVLRPEVSLVMDMDGWGAPWLKRDSYRDYIVRHPVEYTGFKLFYKNDQKKEGSRLMTKEEVLKLRPAPLYIQYQ